MDEIGALPRTPQGNFLKKVSLIFKNFWTWCDVSHGRTMSLLSNRYVGALCLFPHRLGAMRLPSKTTPRLTRASTARAALFSLLVLRTRSMG